MAFTSLEFLLFVALVVLVYYLIPHKARWVVLLVASYTFYLLSSAQTFVFLLFTTVVTFLGGRALGKKNTQLRKQLEEKKDLTFAQKKALKTESKKGKRKIVALILIVDFAVLALLKYFTAPLQSLLSNVVSFDIGLILLPLGISFYTFQSAAYIIDLYREKIDADTNIAKFALFLSFFPQLVQGPIPRYDHLAHQLYEPHKFEYINLAHGAQLILWGFFKKLVIADRVGILVDQVFGNANEYQGWAVALALVFYTIQIYADFSGGVDIARGVARCLGIDLAHNFRRPYFSDSLSEFWRRWHMSLSFWCRDYIFFPISLSKRFGKMGRKLRKVFGDRIGKLFPILVAQMATFIVIGIWHGAEFKYVAYGLYNGLIIVSGLLLEPLFTRMKTALHIKDESKGWKLFSILRTFCIVVIGRVFPRGASFTKALKFLASMFTISAGASYTKVFSSFGLTKIDYIILICALLIWFIFSLIQELDERRMLANENKGSNMPANVSQQAQRVQQMQGTKETDDSSKTNSSGSAQEDSTRGVNALKESATNLAIKVVETGAEVRNRIDRLPLVLRWLIYLGGFAAVLVCGVYGPGYDASSFIYRGF